MNLAALLTGTGTVNPIPEVLGGVDVSGLDYDSRRIGPGFLFFAFPGARTDGRNYARQALEKGAVAVVSELPAPEGLDNVWVTVKHGRAGLARASREFYGRPD